MDELQRRFRQLDRVSTPNLWNEAVARSAEVAPAAPWTFSPSAALLAVALTLAALGGTMAVGALLDRAEPVPEAVRYDNGMLVAHRGCGDLVAIDPTSFKIRQLAAAVDGCTDADALWARPAWSLDGRRLVYVVAIAPRNPASAGAWLYDAETDAVRQLDACQIGSCGEIDISPDGSLVAYTSRPEDGPAELVVIGVDSGTRLAIELIGRPERPVFSPDGSRIAIPMLGGQSGIYLIDVSGVTDGAIGTPSLLHGIVEASTVSWSPDGSWIAYTQHGGLGLDEEQTPFNGQIGHSGTGIVAVRADGTDARVLATGPADEAPAFPTWSADSTSVAYITAPGEGAEPGGWAAALWTVAIDGGEPTRIYESACCVDTVGWPDWSPDGEWITFGIIDADLDPDSVAILVRPDGSDVREVPNVWLEPIWQPIPRDD